MNPKLLSLDIESCDRHFLCPWLCVRKTVRDMWQIFLHSDSLPLEWDHQKDSGLIPMDQDHSSRPDPFVGLLMVSVGFHTAGRSCWGKFLSLLWQQLSNGAVAFFVEETAEAHASFKYIFTKYMHTVSNTCSHCVMVKQICPRKSKLTIVSCLRTLGCL